MITAYPLQWPTGWPRTDRPSWSRFQASQSEAQRGIVSQVRLLGGRNLVISTNVPLRQDGLPYASRRDPEDKGVAVYFDLNGENQCIPCDKWSSIGDNMRAIEKTIDALRGIERWGAKEMVNAAFRGFKALPQSIIVGAGTSRAWWEVLEVQESTSLDVIEAAYKKLLHRVHPDKGGTVEEFTEVQNAFKQAKELKS